MLQKRAVRVKIPTTLTIRKMMTDFSRNRTESQITAKRNIRQSQRVIQKRMLRSRQLRLHFSAVLTK